ncbi:MAG: B12-binding domain-containing radical SAM protein [Oligoflexia bacterium]|nr:B12-binding domain-containing radical SAM protein [Oligoflexia bacterium]
MKLALIYPPHYHKLFNENLFTVDDEFGKFPYISYGYVAVEAKKFGIDVRLFECTNKEGSKKESNEEAYLKIKEQVLDFAPDLLSFPAHAAQTFQDMLKWAYKFKRDTCLPILVGGYEAKFYPTEIIGHSCFDFLCSGEAFPFLSIFFREFFGNRNYNLVPDLYFRDNGNITYTFKGPFIPFYEWPIPDRSIFNNNIYYSFVSQKKNFTVALSSFGCPYSCVYCCMSKTKYQYRKPDQVIEEIRICIEDYNINEIDFFDPLMFHDKRRVEGICEGIKKQNLNFIWSARVRTDSLVVKENKNNFKSTLPDVKFIEKLALSGCKRLFIGLESGSDLILENIKKNYHVKNTFKVLQCLKDYDIRPLGFFMIGNPGETKKTVKQTIRFAKKLPLDYAQFSMTIVKPHTELEQKHIINNSSIDYWREYIRGNIEEKILPSPWTKLTREEIELLTKRAYLHFYLRPKLIIKTIKQIHSFTEFFRYIKVALKMVLRGNSKHPKETAQQLENFAARL